MSYNVYDDIKLIYLEIMTTIINHCSSIVADINFGNLKKIREHVYFIKSGSKPKSGSNPYFCDNMP